MDTERGSFMQMLSGEDDVEAYSVSVPCEAIATQSSAAKAQKRAGNYTHQEDIQLCKSWDNITTDPIVGNEQPGKAYWKRIYDHYHANRDFDSDRNANSLEHCWNAIQKECSRFQGFYEQIERRHPSGIPYKEHILEAQLLFSLKDPKNKSFQFLHCWLQVRNCQKFLALGSNKKPRTSKSSTAFETQGGEEEDSGKSPALDSLQASHKRPIGRKQAKEKLKSAGGIGLYKEALQELLLVREKEAKAKEERWKETKMMQERKMSLEERKLMWIKRKKSCSVMCPP